MQGSLILYYEHASVTNAVGARFSCKHPPNNRVDHYEHTKQNPKNQILHVDKFWLKITTDTFPEIIIITLCNLI